jgi:hypothetical protein
MLKFAVNGEEPVINSTNLGNSNTNNKQNNLNNLNQHKYLEEASKRAESVEVRKGSIYLFSDEEGDGYKSGSSCFSDKQYSFKNNVNNNNQKLTKKQFRYPILTSVTIDLVNKDEPFVGSNSNSNITNSTVNTITHTNSKK